MLGVFNPGDEPDDHAFAFGEFVCFVGQEKQMDDKPA